MKLLLIIVIVAHWLMIVVKGLFMFPPLYIRGQEAYAG